MKKLLLVACLAAAAFAQEPSGSSGEKLSIFGAMGFGFGVGGELYTATDASSTSTKEEDKYLNYGQGFKLDFGARYGLMENLGAQADFELSFGMPGFELVDKTSATTSTTTYKRSMYGIKLLVVPQFEMLELITMYSGVGIGFFWNSLRYEKETTTAILNTSEKGKIVSRPALGFCGLLGADYPLTDRFTLFGELAFNQVSFKWKKRVVDESTTSSEIGTHFYEEDDPNNPAPPKVPGSNWQIRIGARFGLL